MELKFEEVCDFFEKEKYDNIFGYKQKGDLSLEKLVPEELENNEVLSAMQSILKAVTFLHINMIFPSQLKYDYVVRVKGIWGLRHAVCNRQLSNFDEIEMYASKEYAFHSDATNELVWNLGKIWLRFFTQTKIDVSTMSQSNIDEVVETHVKHLKFRALIKRMLCKDAHSRIHFESLILDELLVDENDANESHMYSQIIEHIGKASTIYHKTRAQQNKNTDNPFLKARNSQHFEEFLETYAFMSRNAEYVKNYFYDPMAEDSGQAAQFIEYIVLLQTFQQMEEIYSEKIRIGVEFKGAEQRKYYSEFVKKMVEVKEKLAYQKQSLKKSCLGPNFDKFFVNPSDIEKETVYSQYKSVEELERRLETNVEI